MSKDIENGQTGSALIDFLPGITLIDPPKTNTSRCYDPVCQDAESFFFKSVQSFLNGKTRFENATRRTVFDACSNIFSAICYRKLDGLWTYYLPEYGIIASKYQQILHTVYQRQSMYQPSHLFALRPLVLDNISVDTLTVWRATNTQPKRFLQYLFRKYDFLDFMSDASSKLCSTPPFLPERRQAIENYWKHVKQ